MITKLKKGDHVSFEGDPYIYIVEDPKPFQCESDCKIGHESSCFDEPYIAVRQETRMWRPVRELHMVYDPITSIGKRVI